MMKPVRDPRYGCDPLPNCAPLRPMRQELANECRPWPDEMARSETIEFGRAVEREIPRLRRYALAMTRDRQRADDLVQNCLARALAKPHLWTPGTDLRAWLFTILHNLHVSDLRRSMREDAYNQSVMTVMTAAPRQPDARLELRDLDRAISELPEVQRAAVLLIGLEEMTYDQVAAVLGVPIGTVRSRLSRGRAELRKCLLRPRGPKGRGAAPEVRDQAAARRISRRNGFCRAAGHAPPPASRRACIPRLPRAR
jgi:RNA polymerase sigma-70 factor, ECF subfamily